MKDAIPGILTPTPAEFPDMADALRRRDEGMALVAQNAEDARPDFGEDAERFILNYITENGPTSGEELVVLAVDAGIRPHNERAFGPVFGNLSRRGAIIKVRQQPRARGHGADGCNVWGLAGRDVPESDSLLVEMMKRDVVASHRALDRVGVDKTKTVPARHIGLEAQEITLSLEERINLLIRAVQ